MTMSSLENQNTGTQATEAAKITAAGDDSAKGGSDQTKTPAAAARKKAFEKDASKYSLEALLELKQKKPSDFNRLDFRGLNSNDLDKLFPAHGDLQPPMEMRSSSKKIAEWRKLSKEDQRQAATGVTRKKKDFEKDASKHTMAELLEMREKRPSTFDRLDFRGIEPNDLDKLFPAHGDLRPPKEMRLSAKRIQEWRRMSKEEQLGYEGRKPQPYAGGDVAVGRGISENTRHPVLMELLKAPMAPPLSHPIPYLEEKKRLVNIRLFFQEVPADFTEEDWKKSSTIQKVFRPKKDFGGIQPPQCLLLDAQTVQDKLTIINWWQFLSNEQQKREIEHLKNTYSHPRTSNRLLPADFFAKVAAYEKRYEERNKPKPPPTESANEFYVRWPKNKKPKELEQKKDMSCRGWSGARYDELFRVCYFETLKDLTMEGGAKVLDSFPIPETVSQAKLAKDLVFVREGDNYVLRSVGCTKKKAADKPGKAFCECCHALSATVGHIKQDHIRRGKREVEKAEKQQEKVKSLKRNLRSALNREKRLKSRSDDRKDGEPPDPHEPSPKRQRAPASPKRLPMVTAQQQNHGFVPRVPPPPPPPPLPPYNPHHHHHHHRPPPPPPPPRPYEGV